MIKVPKFSQSLIQPLDRIAIAMILILSLLIGLVIWEGDAVKPNVRDFTWQNQQIGADDISFTMTFSRPMDKKSVENNLKIAPPLAGKTSWAGRRLVYTLLTPAPYGTNYKVELEGAKDKFSTQAGNKRLLQPFTGSFNTRNRVIIYIGTSPEDKGKLVLYDLTQGQKKVLTPEEMTVMDFQPFPNGEKILFSARSAKSSDLLSAQIYTVTTGIPSKSGQQTKPPGKVAVILDNGEYQNLKYDLSSDGETLVIQRGKRDNPGEFGLWYLSFKEGDGCISNEESGAPHQVKAVNYLICKFNAFIHPPKNLPKPLKSQPGGDFMITPDSKAVAVSQGQGTAILSIQSDASKPLDFLPQFGLVQAFSKDGSQAAMVKFNTDYTKDLFLVTNQDIQQQLLRTTGSILNCQFDTASPNLYCLVTQLISKEQYIEQPYLVEINLKTKEQKTLLMLPQFQRNVKMSLAPDGLGLLFDQVVPITNTTTPLPENTLKTDDGQPIASSSLWLMPLLPVAGTTNTIIKPEQLPLAGFSPRWLP